MPKLNPLGIAIATVAFYFIGFLWYGVIFSDAWMAGNGVTAADAEGGSPLWMIAGLIITVMQVLGLAIIVKWKGVSGLGDAAQTAVIVWGLIALPLTLYDFVYMPAHDVTLLMIDAGHLLAGWVVSTVILSLFK